MPTRILTDRFIATLKPPAQGQLDHFCASTTGLCLRIFKSGHKSWLLRYTWAGRRCWLLLGSYPATSLVDARAKAIKARGQLENGADPKAASTAPLTLRTVCERYTLRNAKDLRTRVERQGVIDKRILPALGNIPIADLKRSDINNLLNQLQDEYGASSADKVLAILRPILNWWEIQADDYRSPIVKGMSRDHAQPRSRTLNDEELKQVWTAANDAGEFGRFIKLLLLTACRRNELLLARWGEITTDGEFVLPASRSKTGVEVIRPLSAAALALLGDRGADGDFVFPGLATSSMSWAKDAFDKATGEMEPYRLHDLRRTSRTLLSRCGVSQEHAEACLGHLPPKIVRTYNLHTFIDEQRRAYEALSRLIDTILNPRPSVVTLRRRVADA
jgi:integrase